MPDTTTPTDALAEMLDQARSARDLALAAGADDVVAAVSRDRGLSFRWRDDRIENVQEDGSRGLAVSLYVDGRYSSHTTNDLEPARLDAFLKEAVELTRHLAPDPFRAIPDPALYEGRADVDLDLLDPKLVGLTRDERLDWCRALHDHAHRDESVVSVTSMVGDGHAQAARVSSNGFEGTHEASSAWYGATVTIREGETKRPEDAWFVGGTHLEPLPSAAEVGAEALRRVLARRGSAKVPSRRTTMLVHPEAGAMLIGRMVGALQAGAIQQERSFLVGKLDEQIASPVLTLTDAPLLPRGLGSRHFDGEGIASRSRSIVDQGVLRSFYVDTYYGRKLEWAPTTGSPSNLLFEHGEKDLAGLLADVDDGILVTSWIGGNANPTTGDFSYGVRGHVVKSGQLAEPVSEMNVTGNYLDLLGRLTAVGNDPVPWYSCRTPTLVFEDTQFSGS